MIRVCQPLSRPVSARGNLRLASWPLTVGNLSDLINCDLLVS